MSASLNDTELWKALISQLKDKMTGVGALTDDSRVYVPPLNAQGVPAGTAVHKWVTNYALYRTGDALLQPSNPLFQPGKDSYSRRLAEYLNLVQLESNVQPGYVQILEQARKNSADATKALLKVKKEALAAFNGDDQKGSQKFQSWARENYPEYDMVKSQADATKAALNQAESRVQGPGFQNLQQARNRVQSALDESEENTYNMKVSTDAAGTSITVPAPEKTAYAPEYAIDSAYASTVQGWINASKDPTQTPWTVSFSTSTSSKYSWENSGFNKATLNASSSDFSFFSAQYRQDGEDKVHYINVSNSDDKVEGLLSAQSAASFKLSPGSWDLPQAKTQYPRLMQGSPQDLLQPLIRVTDILVGYNVSLKVTLSQSLYDRVSSKIDEAKSQNANVRLMGFEIGTSSSSNSGTNYESVKTDRDARTFEIPAGNTAFPTLLAVLGVKTG